MDSQMSTPATATMSSASPAAARTMERTSPYLNISKTKISEGRRPASNEGNSGRVGRRAGAAWGFRRRNMGIWWETLRSWLCARWPWR